MLLHLLLLLLSVAHVNHLVPHGLLLLVECVGEPPKLLRLRKLTLHLAILVVTLLPLEHLELTRRVLDPALDHVDLVTHQPEALLHLLLHTEDLLRDQRSQRSVGATGLGLR